VPQVTQQIATREGSYIGGGGIQLLPCPIRQAANGIGTLVTSGTYGIGGRFKRFGRALADASRLFFKLLSVLHILVLSFKDPGR